MVVVEEVIPGSDVDAVKQDVLAAQVGHVGGFISFNQAIAPYLAESSVLGPIEALLGPRVKISFTTATINFPNNPRSGWHADWPFNQNNAGHIDAPSKVLWPGSRERQILVEKTGLADNDQQSISAEVFERLPEKLKPLFSHRVDD